MRPKPISRPAPRYPTKAKRARIQGSVIVSSVITKEGVPMCLEVLRGLPLGLSDAAVDAVRQWRFVPATMAGEPVEVLYNLTVNFELR